MKSLNVSEILIFVLLFLLINVNTKLNLSDVETIEKEL